MKRPRRVSLHIVLFEVCSAFTHVAACTLARSPIRGPLSEGFSHFVTSMTAPVASGWSGCRVGLTPTGKRRFCHGAHPKTDLRAGFDRFSPENLAANRPIIDWLARFADKKNATPAQVSLAWLLAQKPWIVPIPGTRNPDHLSENLNSIHVQLTADDLREIDGALSHIRVHGGRMNEEQMLVVDQTA